jgi:hypothetical protein
MVDSVEVDSVVVTPSEVEVVSVLLVMLALVVV